MKRSCFVYMLLLIGFFSGLSTAYGQGKPIVTVTYDENITLRTLAKDYLGEPNDWELIMYYNGYGNLNDIPLGATIKIPVKDYKDLSERLEESKNLLAQATNEGAGILAKDLLQQAADKQREALSLKKSGKLIEAIVATRKSIDQAKQAMTETQQKRLQTVTAILSEKRGKVQSKAEVEVVWKDADKNQELQEKERIRTLSNSNGELSFVDGSKLNLGENSLAVIENMKQDVIKNSNTSSVVVLQGDIMAYLASQSQKNQVKVSAPGVETDIRSRKFRTSRDENEVTKFANYEGEIDVKAAGSTVTIKENEGTTIESGKKPEAAVKLLDAPEILSPVPKQKMFSKAVSLEWKPVPGAASYVIELSDSRAFSSIIDRKNISNAAKMIWKASNTGVFYLQIASIDGKNNVGPFSKSVEFYVEEDNVPPYLMVENPEETATVFEEVLEVRGTVEKSAQLTIDGAPVKTDETGKFRHPLSLRPGAQTIVLIAKDEAGNVTEIKRSVIYSQEDKLIYLGIPTEISINTREFSLTGKVKTLTKLKIQGQAADISENSFNQLLTLREGTNTITLEAENQGKKEAVTLKIIADLTAPEIILDDVSSNTNQKGLTLTGSLSEAAKLRVSGSEVVVEQNRFSYPVILNEGANVFVLTAEDGVGNQTKTEVKITRDSEAPQVASYAFSKNKTTGGELIQLSVKVTDRGVGLARNANYRIEVVPGGGELSGVLGLTAQRDGYSGNILIPPGFSGEIRLKQIEVSDYLGNKAQYP